MSIDGNHGGTFFGVQGGRPSDLFDAFVLNPKDGSVVKDDDAWVKATAGFMDRFGLSQAVRKNADMINAMDKPIETISTINAEYATIAATLVGAYRAKYDLFCRLGFSEEEAKREADAYITPLIGAEIRILKIKYPYTFDLGTKDGSKKKKWQKKFAKSILDQSEQGQKIKNAEEIINQVTV